MPSAATALPESIHFDAFLAKLTPKDRLNVERHLAAVEEQSTRAHARLWKRVATLMATLATHSAKANGQQSMQFYVADGKYRMQVFALEDLRDGTLNVYCRDVLDEAIAAKVLKAAPADNPTRFPVNASEALIIDQLDNKTSNPAPFYKDMLGWNRRAAKIALPAMAGEAETHAVERLLSLAAHKATAKEATGK